MKSKSMLKRSARSVCAALAVGSLFAVSGCDPMDGVVTLVQTTAQAAIQDAVGGILGGVIPGAGGS